MATARKQPAVPQFTKDIARVIKGLMSERGVTQKQIASAIGKSQPYVSAKVNGRDSWDVHELEVIASVLQFASAFELLDVVRHRTRE